MRVRYTRRICVDDLITRTRKGLFVYRDAKFVAARMLRPILGRESVNFSLRSESGTYGKPEGRSRLTQAKIRSERGQRVLISEISGPARREHVARNQVGRGSGGVQPQWIEGVIDS